MLRILFLFLSFTSYCLCLQGFEGWGQKRLDLISLFLPERPLIVQAGDTNETLAFIDQWPDAKIVNFDEWNEQKVDLLWIDLYCARPEIVNLEGLRADQVQAKQSVRDEGGIESIPSRSDRPEDGRYNGLKNSQFQAGRSIEALKGSKVCLNAARCVYIKTPHLTQEAQEFLEESGLRLLAHWPTEDAIFIRGSFYDNFENTATIEKLWNSIKRNYRRYFVYYPNAFFHIDNVPDSIKSILKKGYPWEGNIGLILERFTEPGSIVIDIGAHIGVHTIALSKKVGPQGAVIAFEPQEKIYLEQLQNLKLNKCTNVISICKALGETAQTIQLTPLDPTNEGGTAIGKGGNTVEMIPLDSLNLSNVSLIKIDVENYEFFTILGAKETILRNKPMIVFELNGSNLEVNLEKEAENYERVITLIKSLGYETYRIHNKDYIAFPAEKAGLMDIKKQYEQI